jgi:PKD repeat protein
VTAIDGSNSGQSVLADGTGVYRFDSLTISNTNFVARASGYLDDSRGTFVNGTNTLNFVLAAAPPPPPPPPPAPSITITSRIISGGGGSGTQEWGFSATGTVPFTSYDWSFGDGTSATDTASEEQHVYRSRGSFTVTVTGKRSSGLPVVGTLVIEVQ